MNTPLPRTSTQRQPGCRLATWLGCLLLAVGAAAAVPPAATRPANRLIHASSPYLRQHAHNPVDWYPWGPEAFARARELNRPIFLSVGYSTCHWCHVMEQESFENPEIAQLLNDNFVCIKVDREERPDIDRVYMTFLQASTGSGGWPMSLWLTPHLKPFLGRTYLPPEDRSGQVGLKSLIPHLARLWKEQGEQIVDQADQMLAALRPETPTGSGSLPIAALRQRALDQLSQNFDPANGGFEIAPKFPSPTSLNFLLDVAATDADAAVRAKALSMVQVTLQHLAAGGIRDQLGGGFHRYAVDAQWRIPHFEKMLYDQAQLVSVYLTAGQLSGDAGLLAVARDTLRYVEQRMTDPAGGFYSAEDADSATSDGSHHEGAFYLWTEGEIARALEPAAANLFDYVHGVQPGGNVTGRGAEEFAGRNILRREHTLAEAAEKFNLTEAQVAASLADSRQKLATLTEQRPRPARDDKILTAWNGLMISAFARAGVVLNDPALTGTAARAADFVHANLWDAATGRLARSFRAGQRTDQAFAEDYAFLVQGLLDLYEADLNPRWLEWAAQLQTKQDELFWDDQGGGYFANTADDPSVILRLKEENDGAEPSANSVATLNLARLAAMLHRDTWQARAKQTAAAFAPTLEQTPLALVQMLVSGGWLEGSAQQILIQGEAGDPATRRLLAEVWSRYLPRKVLLLIDDANRRLLEKEVPFIAELPPNRPREATAYVCQNFTCQLPTSDPVRLAAQLSPTATPASPVKK
jgi:uncharacterized protein